ncbi:MAG: sigma-70 family RNA polymerase sigma factor [Candidatus Poribacteria bacterium]|nr:sigma-70 family RNA polymerase sigma factor [Candidatus Poribacteria bacterium]
MPIDLDDRTLITCTQAGDTEAFDSLVRKYQSRIYAYIHKRVRDAETTQNLTQETWLKAFRAIQTFRGDSCFYSWLYRIAENVCLDYFRKQKALFHIDPLHTINEHRIATFHPTPCDLLQRQELQEYLHAAIATLTPLRKQVFLLYYIEELPVKTIAIQLNKSEGTIKSHLRNARLQLQEHLTPYQKNHNTP